MATELAEEWPRLILQQCRPDIFPCFCLLHAHYVAMHNEMPDRER